MNPKTIIVLFFYLLVIWTTSSSAQNPNWLYFDSTATSYLNTYIVWNVDNDLGNNYYIGTGTGLLQFNFTNWELYNSSNSPIPYDNIPSILINNNTKWIGTYGGGLVKWEGNDWTIYNTSNSGLPHNDILYLAIDPYSHLWMGTNGGGAALFDGSTWSVFNTTNSGIPNNYPRDIDINDDNVKWICTSNGLAKFDGNNWTVYNSANSGIPSNAVDCAAIDNNNNVWVGTRDSYTEIGSGIAKFDGVNWTIYNSSNSDLPDNAIRDIAVDLNENVWIGTNLGGLAKFDGTNWTVFDTLNSPLPVNMIERIFIDKYNNKWITTFSQQFPNFSGYLLVYNENGVTDIDYPIDNLIPNEIKLSQNYPNPFNPTTTINYSIPKTSFVTIKVYDALGKEVKTLVNDERHSGTYKVAFDGSKFASGIYYYRMQAGNIWVTKKLILLK